MAVTDAENQWIAADQPIAKRTDDRLSRAHFSRELAAALAGWTGNSSLTIALYGSWGSGKSSVKNMAVEYLNERIELKPTVIEFNPWRWSNSDELADAFFREVGKGLGRGDDAAKAKKLSKLWQKYSASFSLAAAIVGAVPRLIGGILIAAGTLSLLGYVLAIPQTARAIGGLVASAAPLLGGLLLWSGTLSDKLAKYFTRAISDSPSAAKPVPCPRIFVRETISARTDRCDGVVAWIAYANRCRAGVAGS